jgi:hypothetical protein
MFLFVVDGEEKTVRITITGFNRFHVVFQLAALSLAI